MRLRPAQVVEHEFVALQGAFALSDETVSIGVRQFEAISEARRTMPSGSVGSIDAGAAVITVNRASLSTADCRVSCRVPITATMS
jgi:hypothetical protein